MRWAKIANFGVGLSGIQPHRKDTAHNQEEPLTPREGQMRKREDAIQTN
jgi:hypothetical protein